VKQASTAFIEINKRLEENNLPDEYRESIFKNNGNLKEILNSIIKFKYS
jgi:hypothetical protein